MYTHVLAPVAVRTEVCSACAHSKMIADTTREVITVTSNTGKYPPTYGDLFPYVIERGGTSPDGVEMESSGPWPVTNIHTPSGDEASHTLHHRSICRHSACADWNLVLRTA